jgi:hypothetical protein
MEKQFSLTVYLQRFTWQCLIAMATEDLREPTDFINWLVYVEAKRRGIVKAPPLKPQAERDSTINSGEQNAMGQD